MAEMNFKDATVVKSGIHIYEVPKDPETYGKTDSMPIFNSGDLPNAPFFLRFSPNDETIAMLCNTPSTSTGSTGAGEGESGAVGETSTSLVLLDWAKAYRKDSWAGRATAGRHVPRKATTVLKGSPIFFSYTTSNPKNATIVAHCQQEVACEETKSMKLERGVWALKKRDTAGKFRGVTEGITLY